MVFIAFVIWRFEAKDCPEFMPFGYHMAIPQASGAESLQCSSCLRLTPHSCDICDDSICDICWCSDPEDVQLRLCPLCHLRCLNSQPGLVRAEEAQRNLQERKAAFQSMVFESDENYGTCKIAGALERSMRTSQQTVTATITANVYVIYCSDLLDVTSIYCVQSQRMNTASYYCFDECTFLGYYAQLSVLLLDDNASPGFKFLSDPAGCGKTFPRLTYIEEEETTCNVPLVVMSENYPRSKL